MKLSVLISILIATTCVWADQANPKVDPNLKFVPGGAGAPAADFANPASNNPLGNAQQELILDYAGVVKKLRLPKGLPPEDRRAALIEQLALQTRADNLERANGVKLVPSRSPSVKLFDNTRPDGSGTTVKVNGKGKVKVEIKY